MPYSTFEAKANQQSVTKNASHFFDKLEKAVQNRADKIIEDHVHKMRDTLRFRKPLGGAAGLGDGRYPRWDATYGDKQKSKGSYKQWKVVAYGRGKYKLFNNAQDPATNYAYPINLIYGTGWRSMRPFHTGKGGEKPISRLVHHEGKLFSTQMPHGLAPWLGRKKTELKNKLKIQLGADL